MRRYPTEAYGNPNSFVLLISQLKGTTFDPLTGKAEPFTISPKGTLNTITPSNAGVSLPLSE